MTGKRASQSECEGCKKLLIELARKEQVIRDLKLKLEGIHHMSASTSSSSSSSCLSSDNTTGGSNNGDWTSQELKITRFNVDIGIHHPNCGDSSSPPVCMGGVEDNCGGVKQPQIGESSSSTSSSIKFQVFQQGNSQGHEVRVISIQEIIDKVIEKSPEKWGNEIEVLYKNRMMDAMFDIDGRMDFDSSDLSGVPPEILKRIPQDTEVSMVYNIL